MSISRSMTRSEAFPVTAAVGRNAQTWAWFGLAAFVLGFFVTWSVQFVLGESEYNAGGAPLLDALDSGGTEALYRVTSGLGFVAVACLVAFGAGLRRQLDARAPEGSSLPTIVFSSILITAAGLAIAMAFRAQVFDGFSAYAADPSSHVTMNRLQQDTVLAAWAAMLGATAAMAVGGIPGTMVPKWLGWFSAVMTLLIVVLCLGGAAFPANIPALLWLAVVAVWAVRQPAPGSKAAV